MLSFAVIWFVAIKALMLFCSKNIYSLFYCFVSSYEIEEDREAINDWQWFMHCFRCIKRNKSSVAHLSLRKIRFGFVGIIDIYLPFQLFRFFLLQMRAWHSRSSQLYLGNLLFIKQK